MLVAAGLGAATLSIADSAGVTRAVVAQTLVATYNDLESVAALLGAHPGQAAAVIAEPVAANMGGVAPVPGFLSGPRALTTRSGALPTFDGVSTGGRAAPAGAQEPYGGRPHRTVL